MMRRQLWWMVVFTVATAVGAVAAPEVIKIAAVPGLRYDLKRIYVKPNVEVKWVFENRDTMLHNLVITAPGARMEVVNAAIALANKGMERDYVPESPKVLWAFGVVPQGESQALTFRTPAKRGDYPYVCTYPGHGLIMHGVMTVTDTPKPPVKSQALVPETTQVATAERTSVRMRRAFMPDSGPASIAVTLPGEQSYCWDAGACRFRYAWRGGGIESARPGTKDTRPEKLVGDVAYRETVDFPLRIGDNDAAVPATAFRGYRLDADGNPEFEYLVDGVAVRERIAFAAGKLERRFRVDGNHRLWFRFAPEAAKRLHADAVRHEGALEFDAKDRRECVVQIDLGELK